MRIERGILVVETRDETNRQPCIRHRVDETAAEFFLIERISEGVQYGTARQAGRRHVPQFLDTEREQLWLAPDGHARPPHQLLRQIPANAVGENGDLGVNVDTRLERVAFL